MSTIKPETAREGVATKKCPQCGGKGRWKGKPVYGFKDTVHWLDCDLCRTTGLVNRHTSNAGVGCVGLLIFLLSAVAAFAANPWYGSGAAGIGMQGHYQITLSGASASVVWVPGAPPNGVETDPNGFEGVYNGESIWTGVYEYSKSGDTTKRITTIHATYLTFNSLLASGTFSQTAPTPTPTPTPTPSPTPVDVSGGGVTITDETGRSTHLENGKKRIYVDMDGDGFKEFVGEFDVDEDGNITDWSDFNPAWLGRDYLSLQTGILVSTEVDPDGNVSTSRVPMTPLEGFGTFPSEGPVDMGSGLPIGINGNQKVYVTDIGSNGAVSNSTISVTESTQAGKPVTSYSYSTPGGGSSTVNYVGSGTASITAADIREQTAQLNKNADENTETVADIIQGLQEALDKIEANTSPTPSPTPATPEQLQALADEAFSNLFGGMPSMEVSAPTPTAVTGISQGGGGSFWSIDLGLFGVMNFDPTQNGTAAVLANWVKSFLTWLSTFWFVGQISHMWWQLVTEGNKAPQTLLPSVQVEVFGTGTDLGPLIGGAIVAAITAAVVALTVGWSTYVNGVEPLTGADMGSRGAALFSMHGDSAFDAAMRLCLWFVPVQHFITIGVNWIALKVAMPIFYAAIAGLKRFFFGGN